MWQDVSTNPDDPAVIAHRFLQLQKAKSCNIESLRAFINTFCSGLNVVDFGYANHSPETANIAGESTHSFVSEAAKSVVGVDVVDGSHSHIKGNIYLTGDFLNSPTELLRALTTRPQLIFAGGCLEHFSQPARLFDLAETVLANDESAALVLTVPNLVWLPAIRDVILAGQRPFSSINVDHIAQYDPSSLLELGERNGFTLTDWCFVGRDDMPKLWGSRHRFDIWSLCYRWSRFTSLPQAYNLLGVRFTRR